MKILFFLMKVSLLAILVSDGEAQTKVVDLPSSPVRVRTASQGDALIFSTASTVTVNSVQLGIVDSSEKPKVIVRAQRCSLRINAASELLVPIEEMAEYVRLLETSGGKLVVIKVNFADGSVWILPFVKQKPKLTAHFKKRTI